MVRLLSVLFCVSVAFGAEDRRFDLDSLGGIAVVAEKAAETTPAEVVLEPSRIVAEVGDVIGVDIVVYSQVEKEILGNMVGGFVVKYDEMALDLIKISSPQLDWVGTSVYWGNAIVPINESLTDGDFYILAFNEDQVVIPPQGLLIATLTFQVIEGSMASVSIVCGVGSDCEFDNAEDGFFLRTKLMHSDGLNVGCDESVDVIVVPKMKRVIPKPGRKGV